MSDPVVVIGAGHNGLTAAAWLARAGRRVLVVERREELGGLAADEEFHPGYRAGGLLHDTSRVRPWVVRDLELERQGLRWRERPAELLALGEDGAALGVEDEACRERLGPLLPVLARFVDRPPLDLVQLESGPLELLRRAWELRRLGRRELSTLLRIAPMSVADWLDEAFDDPLLKAGLAYPAIEGGSVGPRAPGTNANLLLWQATTGRGIDGGAAALIGALERAALAAGAQVRRGARAARILTGAGGVRGVALEDGEEIPARAVAAACDPKQLFGELLPAAAVGQRLGHRIDAFRARGTTAWMRLALSSPPSFACRPGEPIEHARTGGSLERLERAADAVKYRRFSEEPLLDICVPTLSDPRLAPSGHHVVSIRVHFVPRAHDPPWDADLRRRLGDRVLAVLERHAPGVCGSIVAQDLALPADLEARFGLSGGQIHHGEHALDQLLVRPVPECSGYRTPIAGLFLCGSGSHPGGGLTCAPGALGASVVHAALARS